MDCRKKKFPVKQVIGGSSLSGRFALACPEREAFTDDLFELIIFSELHDRSDVFVFILNTFTHKILNLNCRKKLL